MNLDELKAKYDDFEYFYPSFNKIIVEKNSRVGVIDLSGNIIIPLVYETIYFVDFNVDRIVAQMNKTWFVLDKHNTILYQSKHNYNPSVEWKMNYFDSSYCYVPYCDGFIEHYKDKIILITQDIKKEFSLKSDVAICVDDTPLIYFFDGEIKGYLNIDTDFIQLNILMDVRKKFHLLKAYEVDKLLSIGMNPYSIFEQDLLIDELKNKGVTTLISLMKKNEVKYCTQELKKYFNIVHIPIENQDVPNIENLYQIINIIDKSEVTYIHCDLELYKLGVIVAYYFYKKYSYKGENLLKKMQELQMDSIFCSKEALLSKKQKEFLLRL